MRIIKVESKKDMESFVRLPEFLHGDNACFAPPIWLDEKNAYYGKTNPILANSDYVLFLAVNEKSKPVGRTIAYIDFNHNKYYKTDMGFFGALNVLTINKRESF